MKKLFQLLAAFSLLVCACQKVPVLSITGSTSVELSADGSSGSITFTANRDWTATSSANWIHVSPSSGSALDGPITVKISCDANTTYEDRSGTVTIKAEDLTQTVSVRQPANLGVIVATKAYNLASDARTFEVEVQANVQYSVSVSAEWVRQTGTKGLKTDKLTFSVDANETYDNRSATITIKPQSGGVADQVISVKQAQKDALIIKDKSFDMPYGGSEIEFKVEANVDFEVKPDVDWLHYLETKALSNSTVRLSVDENPTYEAREGRIEIKQKNGSLSHTITVKQAGRIAVTSVTLDRANLTLKEGESATLVATVTPDNATDKTVTWTSSDPAVATVDETGIVAAAKEGTATITASAGGKSASCAVTVEKIVVPDGAVDLGIVMTRRDGSTYRVFWAECNLGATKPEGNGDGYAWGETSYKTNYSWSTYKWANGASNKLTRYCYQASYWDGVGNPDGITELFSMDDVAHIRLGGKWRMPTAAEWIKLEAECQWTWKSENGVNGYEVKSRTNGNTIFLPALGHWSGARRLNVGSDGYYWSSSLDGYSSFRAGGVLFRSSGLSVSGTDRSFGQSVRPVTE